jgi:hypothetical protein
MLETLLVMAWLNEREIASASVRATHILDEILEPWFRQRLTFIRIELDELLSDNEKGKAKEQQQGKRNRRQCHPLTRK